MYYYVITHKANHTENKTHPKSIKFFKYSLNVTKQEKEIKDITQHHASKSPFKNPFNNFPDQKFTVKGLFPSFYQAYV